MCLTSDIEHGQFFAAVKPCEERQAFISQAGSPREAEAPQPFAAFAKPQQHSVAHVVAPGTVYLTQVNPKPYTLNPMNETLRRRR